MSKPYLYEITIPARKWSFWVLLLYLKYHFSKVVAGDLIQIENLYEMDVL